MNGINDVKVSCDEIDGLSMDDVIAQMTDAEFEEYIAFCERSKAEALAFQMANDAGVGQ